MTSCGFDSLPEQVATRRTMHGIAYNVMVVGPSGIGKTTLINSLFDFDYGDTPDTEREIQEVGLRYKEFKPQNKSTELKLTIVEVKGFSNQLDKSNSYKPIVNYIVSRLEDHLNEELKVQTTRYNDIADGRIHCCIYMISPIGPGLKAIDLVTMKRLHKYVNLIPVIGKSDILSKQERKSFIEKVRQQISLNEIEIYSSDSHHLPLAITASNDISNENGKRRRLRDYPWGRMYIEENSDFSKLRDLVLRSNMLSLIEATDRFSNKLQPEMDSNQPEKHSIAQPPIKQPISAPCHKPSTLEKDLEKLNLVDRFRSPRRTVGFGLNNK